MVEVEVYRKMLALRGRYLDSQSRILDFGCGAGAIVYGFRDLGFDAYGFDVLDYLSLRKPEDRSFFSIAAKEGEKTDFRLDWTQYRLPYADNTFDFVYSSQVMEHVQNHDAVIKELARVMKPGGIAIHSFPPAYRLIEGHTFVPFGGMTKAYWYYRLWAMLGVRNQYQKGLSARETAGINFRYAQTGTNYEPRSKLRDIGARYFEQSYFSPHLWLLAWGEGAVGWRLTRYPLAAYTRFNMVIWLLERPRVTSTS